MDAMDVMDTMDTVYANLEQSITSTMTITSTSTKDAGQLYG